MSRQLDPRLFGEISTNDKKASDELLPQLDRLPQDPTQLRAQMKKKEKFQS